MRLHEITYILNGETKTEFFLLTLGESPFNYIPKEAQLLKVVIK